MTLACRCGQEINCDEIRARLVKNTEASVVLTSSKLRAAAVLIPMVCVQNEWHLLYTRRTETVQSHKGQVSFPGGAAEPHDQDRKQTALRETFEEIGIPGDQIEVLGCLRDMPTITGFVITPVVGKLPWPFQLRLAIDEVSRAFLVPLRWLANPANHLEMDLNLPDGRRERVIYFRDYEGEKIWGATARMTINLIRAIQWM